MFKKAIAKYLDKTFVRCVQCGGVLDRDDMAVHLEYHRINRDKSVAEYRESKPRNPAGVHTRNFSRSSSAERKEMDAYCVQCKEKVQTDDYIIKVSDSGRRMAQGKCPRCGTKINRILGKE